MKWILTFVFVAAMANDIDRIARVNALKEEARIAYNSGNYEKALENYRYLIDSMQVNDDKVMLNLANTLYQLKDTTQAINTYQSVAGSPDKGIGSVAHQQLGILSNRTGNAQEALEHFKQALRKDPANEDARYNYELLKKVLEDEKKKQEEEQKQDKKDQEDKKKEEGDQEKEQQQKQQKQDQEQNKEGEENKEQKEQSEQGEKDEEQQQKDSEQTKEGEQKEEPQQEKDGTPENQEEQDKQKNEARQKEIAERLKDMKISEEKARMILEAMKNNEIQYIQQNKRKATKKRDSSKPDW